MRWVLRNMRQWSLLFVGTDDRLIDVSFTRSEGRELY
jgi:hypothetical protein